MTTIPLITVDLSDPPSSDDPTNFETRADDYLGAFPDLKTEVNATVAAMNTVAGEVAADAATAETAKVAALAAVAVNGFMGTSATSHTVGTGSKAFTTQAGLNFRASGDRVTAMSRGSTAKMRGTSTYVGTTLTITVDETEGEGEHSDWLLVLSALESESPAASKARAIAYAIAL